MKWPNSSEGWEKLLDKAFAVYLLVAVVVVVLS